MKKLIASVFLLVSIAVLGGCGFCEGNGCTTCGTGGTYNVISCCSSTPW